MSRPLNQLLYNGQRTTNYRLSTVNVVRWYVDRLWCVDRYKLTVTTAQSQNRTQTNFT
jgi:hypothetical protein